MISTVETSQLKVPSIRRARGRRHDFLYSFFHAVLKAVLLSAVVIAAAFSSADAAIPSSKMILMRLAKNGGRGTYVVEQEIKFLNASEGQNVLKERWIVQNAESMRLIVTGMKPGEARWDAIYKDTRKVSSVVDAGSNETKSAGVSGDFLEPYLYIRSSAKFLDTFIRNKILPPSAGRPPGKIGNLATYRPAPEQAVRLGRHAGTIAIVFGEPTPIGNSVQFPGAWIEQDSFLLRKLRFPSQVEMSLAAHAAAGAGLKLPRERTITWKPADKSIDATWSAVVKVTSVKNFPDNAFAPQFQATSITPTEAKSAKLPNDPSVREFYSRFR